MLQTYVLIDKTGQEISSGANEKVSVKHFKHTACVNDGEELSVGSVCANAVEITFFDLEGKLSLTAGDEISVFRGENRTKFGRFIVDQPTRPTPNTLKVVGYDYVTRLDADLTSWVNSLTGWPYAVRTFVQMVANKCGLMFEANWDEIPNANYQIQSFSYTGVTGRMLMRWLGEICARYCYADGAGVLRFGWYTSSGVTIHPYGERYYFENGLTYEAYETELIKAVQLQLADSDSGALWPEKPEGTNAYVIRNNAILHSQITEETGSALDAIALALNKETYTPCKLVIPACLDINAGCKVNVADKNGKIITAYVMTKVTEGQKDTLECTGSVRRDSTKSLNNQKPATQNDAVNAAKNAVQKAQEIFGERQGIFRKDGKWYFNGELVQVFNLIANAITSGTLRSVDGNSYFNLDEGELCADDGNGNCVTIKLGDLILDYKGSGQAKVILTAFGDGGRGMIFAKSTGAEAGRFGVKGDDLILACPDEHISGVVSAYTPIWKTVSFMDPSGQQCTMKVLAQG